MRFLLLGAVLAVVVVLGGCAGMIRTPVMPGMGMLFADYRAPLDPEVGPTNLAGTREGMATSENVLGWFITGDCSVRAAAANGGISRVEHADYRFWNILGIYSKFTTIVYGQ